MNNETNDRKPFIAPLLEVLELETEDIVRASGDDNLGEIPDNWEP